jgi:hypothetical protein
MKKSEKYRQIYQAIATYDPERETPLEIQGKGICPLRVPNSIRKKCLVTAAEAAKTLPGTKVVSYYDFDDHVVITRARRPKPKSGK